MSQCRASPSSQPRPQPHHEITACTIKRRHSMCITLVQRTLIRSSSICTPHTTSTTCSALPRHFWTLLLHEASLRLSGSLTHIFSTSFTTSTNASIKEIVSFVIIGAIFLRRTVLSSLSTLIVLSELCVKNVSRSPQIL